MKIGIGSNHDVFANYIFGKYRRTGEYAYSGVSLTFLQPKQDEETKESSVHIAYRLMLQELYFLTHNTIFVNQREILQGITASVERQLELVRKENRAEAMRIESLIRQIRETKDNEQLLRIEHEIGNRLGINIISKSERKSGTDDQTSDQTAKVTDLHNAVIDRYFERLQSAVVSEVSLQTNGTNTQESVLEQQRKLLSEVYAESTEQEKEEFASYLEERQLLYKMEDKAVKGRKIERDNYIVQDGNIVHKVMNELGTDLTKEITGQITNELEANLTKEITEQATKELETNLTKELTKQLTIEITKEITEQITKELEANLTKETTEQKIKEHETDLTKEIAKEITKQVTSEIENDQVNKTENKIENEIENKINNINEDVVESKLVDYQGKNQTSQEYAEQVFEQTIRITDNAFADAVKNKVAKVSEILQTISETQFQQMQQVFMESYEKQQLSQLQETEELQLNIGTGLTHIQKDSHNAVIGRYFEKLQSAMVSEASMLTKKANVQETVFEQQRNLLSRIYAESTEQEKEEFASYLEERQLLYKTEDKVIKGRKTEQDNNIVHAVMNELERNLTGEIREQVTEAFETNLTKEIREQVTEEIETNLTKEITQQVIEELETNLAKKTASQVTSAVGIDQANKKKYKIENEIENKTENVLESEIVDYRGKDQISIGDTEQTFGKMIHITDNAFADVIKNNAAKVSEMLQTISETQFQEMQQVFMEAYEKQQISQLAETEGLQLDIGTGLTHIQKNFHNAVIDRYFGKLQSAMILEASMLTKKANVQETVFEQQRNLLSRIYAESTEQEKEEFVSYLEERQLLYKTEQKAVKERKIDQDSNTIHEVMNQLETNLTKEITDQVTKELNMSLTKGITDQATNEHLTKKITQQVTKGLETNLTREITDQVTKDLETSLTKKTASQVTSEIENDQIFKEYVEQTRGKMIHITDNEFADSLKNKVKKVSKMLQTVNETQFQEMQQVFMEAYERRRLFQLAEIEENHIGIETSLTHNQKKQHNSIIERYFEGLQSVLVSESVQAKKTNSQQAMFALQRTLLSKVYEESTEQERAEFVSYLEENSLIYKTADKTGKDDETRLVNEMSDQITREIGTRLSHKITNKEFETSLTRKNEKHIFKERTNLHHSIIDRYLSRLQSMLMSGSVQTEKPSTQEMVFDLHRNILNRVYTESTEQEKEEFVSGLELSYLAAKKKREDSQGSGTKIQEIVERCMEHTTRITESENVRRQINDQKNEIVQLKTQVQRQQEEMSELVRKSSRVLNMDRMYQEIEKRMESRLHLERLRRGM